MSKNFKIFLGFIYLLILAVFLYLIFSNIQINRLDDFTYYKKLQLGFDSFITSNLLINITYFFIFATIWVALLGFGAPILIISGILFGKWVGTLVSLLSMTLGALALYSIANFFLAILLKIFLKKNFKNISNYFKKMSFIIFSSLDLQVV